METIVVEVVLVLAIICVQVRVVVVDLVNFYILKNKKIDRMCIKGVILFMKIAIYGFGNVGKWMCRRLLNSQKFILDLSIYVYDDLKSTVELNHEYIKTFKNDIPDFLNFFGNDKKLEFDSIY